MVLHIIARVSAAAVSDSHRGKGFRSLNKRILRNFKTTWTLRRQPGWHFIGLCDVREVSKRFIS